jgi:hypothetical protein
MATRILPECDVVDILTADAHMLVHAAGFALSANRGPYTLDTTGALVAGCLPREELGLPPGVPGDIDILAIPFRDDRMLYRRAAVIEVKVVRPTVRNLARNSNSLGRRQVLGLLADGFPYVGLLHVCMPEPCPDSWRQEFPEYDLATWTPKGTIALDPLPSYSIARQRGRLRAHGLPRCVGMHCLALGPPGADYSMASTDLRDRRRCKRNPLVSGKLISRLRRHLDQHASRYRRIAWFE